MFVWYITPSIIFYDKDNFYCYINNDKIFSYLLIRFELHIENCKKKQCHLFDILSYLSRNTE